MRTSTQSHTFDAKGLSTRNSTRVDIAKILILTTLTQIHRTHKSGSCQHLCKYQLALMPYRFHFMQSDTFDLAEIALSNAPSLDFVIH